MEPLAPGLITAKQLQDISDCSARLALQFISPINLAANRYQISTPPRIQMFMAQISHESMRFTHLEESFAYRPGRLFQIFPTHFADIHDAMAVSARGHVAVANRLYGGRLGNGDEESGDGWRYRGRGLIQITGKDEYLAMSKDLGLDFIANPDALTSPLYGALSAARYWQRAGCNEEADAGNFDHVSDLINRGRITRPIGDAIGYPDRLALYQAAQAVIG